MRTRILRLSAALLTTIVSTGCLQSTVLVKVNSDGSGTIDNQMLMTAAGLTQMRMLAGVLGGRNGQPVDPFSERQMRELGDQMGEGVTFVSSKPIKTAGSEGRETLYSFRDITKLRVSETPETPGGASVRAGGVALGAGQETQVTIDLAKTPAGTVLLTFHTPADPLGGLVERFGSSNGTGTAIPPEVREMLGGMRVALRVEPAGRLVRTSSPYVDGKTVTLFDIDVDALLKDEAALSRLQNAKTASEASAALKGVPGLKLNLEPEITIEFAP
jgi:hypothetical protein